MSDVCTCQWFGGPKSNEGVEVASKLLDAVIYHVFVVYVHQYLACFAVLVSDWQGFCQSARFKVGVERGQVQVVFCVPRQYPYLQWGFYGFATSFQHLSMFINTGEYTLQSCYNVLSTLSSSSLTLCIP